MGTNDLDGIGPVEILAVGFPTINFDGSIISAIADLVKKNIIRVLDLMVVIKDEDGEVMAADFDDLDEDATATFIELSPAGLELLGEDDIALAVQAMPNGSAAAVLVWEDVWAAPVADAIRAAGGILLAHEQVSVEVLEELASYEGSDQ